MDSVTSTDGVTLDINMRQENVLLEIIKEVCWENKLSQKLKDKVNKIIADCDLKHYSSLHKLSASDESTATVLGMYHFIYIKNKCNCFCPQFRLRVCRLSR